MQENNTLPSTNSLVDADSLNERNLEKRSRRRGEVGTNGRVDERNLSEGPKHLGRVSLVCNEWIKRKSGENQWLVRQRRKAATKGDERAARPAALSFSSSAPRSLAGSWGNAKQSETSRTELRSSPRS